MRVWHEAFTFFSQIKALTGWRMLSNNDIFALLGEGGRRGRRGGSNYVPPSTNVCCVKDVYPCQNFLSFTPLAHTYPTVNYQWITLSVNCLPAHHRWRDYWRVCPGLVITLGLKHSFSCIYLLFLFSVEIIANESLSEVVAKLQAEVSYLYIHKQKYNKFIFNKNW